MSNIVFFLIFFPMLVSVVIYCRAFKTEKTNLSLIILTTAIELVGVLFLYDIPDSTITISSFSSVGISFTYGYFRSVMATITVFVWMCGVVFAKDWFNTVKDNKRFYAFALFVLGATLGVFFAKDLMTLFIFFELMSLASYVWVAHPEDESSVPASQTYLYVGIIGGLSMLTGIILLYSACGTLSFNQIHESVETIPEKIRTTSGILMLVGFGAKAGMFPIHIWMPRSYPAAPTPGTILLSGVLSKCGVFGISLISLWMLSGVRAWGNLLLSLAIATMFVGALLALFSTDLKKTLACSSMSQVGFILVALSMLVLTGHGNSMGVSGTVLHVLNHSVIKTCLFTIGGIIYMIAGTTELNSIRGCGKGKPYLLICFALVSCSIVGIPGFSGYISKTLMHESIVHYIEMLEHNGLNAGSIKIAEILFLVSGGLTFAYMSRLFYILFVAKADPHSHANMTHHYMSIPVAVIIGITSVSMPVLGLTPNITMDKIAQYSSMFFLRAGAYGVNYFSLENLKGAFISICIGIAIFLLVGMQFLTKRKNGKEIYLDRWPKWLDLEYRVYRPVLSMLSTIGAAIARLLETISALLVLGPVNIIFYNAETEWKPKQDNNFNVYNKKENKSIVRETFSYDLILACIGICVFLIFVLIKVI